MGSFLSQFGAASITGAAFGLNFYNIMKNDLGVDVLGGGSIKSEVSVDGFMRQYAPDGTRWNKVFPYVLRIYDPNENTSNNDAGTWISNLSSGLGFKSFKETNNGDKGDINNQIKFPTFVVLPIAPTNISISTPAASNLTATLSGIVEEHNGAPFREIRITGTTGIAPYRGINFTGKGGEPTNKRTLETLQDIGRSLLPQTTSAVSNFINLSGGTASILDSELMSGKGSASDETGIYGTGYWHFHKLFNFVDNYLKIKRQRADASKYLIFEMHKDQVYYNCSLRNFSWQKKAGTMEYEYTIVLTAWSYHEMKSSIEAQKRKTSEQRSTGQQLTNIARKLGQSRRILNNLSNIGTGLMRDLKSIEQVFREAQLAYKILTGTSKSASDYPDNITKQLEGRIKDNSDAFRAAALASTDPKIQALAKKLADSNEKTMDGNLDSQGISTSNSIISTKQDPIIADIFNNPTKYFDFFNAINISSIDLPDSIQESIEKEEDRIATLDLSYYTKKRDEMMSQMIALENQLGVDSVTYNRIHDIEFAKKNANTLKGNNLEILAAMNEAIQSLNVFVYQMRVGSKSIEVYTNYYIAVAQANGIDMSTPQSKIPVPFPTNATIQGLAQQYLGDPNRWLEIAAINGLKAPYVDEDGFERNIVGSASGKTITVANSDNLYIGQPIIVTAPNLDPKMAKIKNINIFGPATVYLDLDVDVSGYSESVGGKIKANLPNTVNSNMLIYIPSDKAPRLIADSIKLGADSSDQDRLTALSGVDFLLTQDGDLAVSGGGDVKLASGMSNLQQAAKLKLMTPKGHLLQHPWYGVGTLAGISTAEVDMKSVSRYLETAFTSDPRYSGILASKLFKIGPTMVVDILLGLPNTDATVPINSVLK